MPWKETKLMELREQFITTIESGFYSMSELCTQYEISRKTGYKWIRRGKEGGTAELCDRSTARKGQAHRTPSDVRTAIVKCRKDHPKWGSRKIIAYLRTNNSFVADRLPAPSTAGDILKAEGLVVARKKRRRSPHPGSGPIEADEPNRVWCIDFKGEFKTGDGVMCYPLTVTDACTRYLLLCKRLPSIASQGVREALELLFKTVGLPEALRSDNGAPFCSPAIRGISRPLSLVDKVRDTP